VDLNTGAKMPQVGLGVWKVAKDVTAGLVFDAISRGVRHLDCASDYGNEVEVGQGIKRAIDAGVCTRSDLWVTSKLWNTYHRKEHVRAACERSLSDLGLQYVDLYLIHFPICLKFVPFETRYPPEWVHDPSAASPQIEEDPVPVSETWAAMEALVDAGLAKNIGVANFNVQSVADLLSYCRIRPSVNQVEVHPYLPQARLLQYCKKHGVHVTAFSPLGSASYVELGMDQKLGGGCLTEVAVLAVAEAVGRTPAQVVLRYGVQRGLSIIPKSSRVERVVENFSLFDFTLTEEQMASVEGLSRGARFNDAGVYSQFMGGYLPIFD
jgi:diketogulonate reductase-like aldo/keto reductase